jgi:3-hydroxyisobutyrate dehydrogenase-like beta-hydroxyacid dehydrogenase
MMKSEPLDWRIGLVGYGEVGRILAEDLRKRGVAEVDAFDTKPAREHARTHGVRMTASHAELSKNADLIVSAVTASQAVAVAEACAKSLKAGAWYLDFNSASPGAKKRAAAFIDSAGGRYVEGAVMTAVPTHRIGVPLLLGGSHASELEPLLNALGFNSSVASHELGIASATKMCRSIMMKGLEAMLIECLTTARAYGVEDDVLASLRATFPGIDWAKQGNYAFQRVIRHGRRRSEEMREAAVTVREIGLEPWSAGGTAERQAWMARLADDGAFEDRAANDWRVEADRILATFRQ